MSVTYHQKLTYVYLMIFVTYFLFLFKKKNSALIHQNLIVDLTITVNVFFIYWQFFFMDVELLMMD